MAENPRIRTWATGGGIPGSMAMCQICFELSGREGLEPVSDEPGRWWDICLECAAREKQLGATY